MKNILNSLSIGAAALAAALSLSVASAAEPVKPAPVAAPAAAAAKANARRSPYARAARENAEASNGVIDKVQADGKVTTSRKAVVSHDQAKAAASHAKAVQKHATH